MDHRGQAGMSGWLYRLCTDQPYVVALCGGVKT